MSRLTLVGLLAVTVTAVACSRDGEPGSCLRNPENVCVQYTAAQGAAGKRMCMATWTPGEKSCPAANRLGACTKPDGVELYYSGAPNNYVATSAKSRCESGSGVFTAP